MLSSKVPGAQYIRARLYHSCLSAPTRPGGSRHPSAAGRLPSRVTLRQHQDQRSPTASDHTSPTDLVDPNRTIRRDADARRAAPRTGRYCSVDP
jgi:hypothetical protein